MEIKYYKGKEPNIQKQNLNCTIYFTLVTEGDAYEEAKKALVEHLNKFEKGKVHFDDIKFDSGGSSQYRCESGMVGIECCIEKDLFPNHCKKCSNLKSSTWHDFEEN